MMIRCGLTSRIVAGDRMEEFTFAGNRPRTSVRPSAAAASTRRRSALDSASSLSLFGEVFQPASHASRVPLFAPPINTAVSKYESPPS